MWQLLRKMSTVWFFLDTLYYLLCLRRFKFAFNFDIGKMGKSQIKIMCTSLEVDTLKNTCKLYNRRTPKICLCTRLDFLTVQYMQILFGNFIFCNNQGLFWNRGTFLSWPRKDAMHPEYQTCIFIVLSESEVSAYSLIALNKSHNYQNYTMKGIFFYVYISIIILTGDFLLQREV